MRPRQKTPNAEGMPFCAVPPSEMNWAVVHNKPIDSDRFRPSAFSVVAPGPLHRLLWSRACLLRELNPHRTVEGQHQGSLTNN